MQYILSILALVISFASAVFAGITFFWTAKRGKRQATLDAFNKLQTEVFDKINLKTPAEIKDIAVHPRSPEYKEMSAYIARIEHFCVGVNQNVYDKKTLFDLAHGYFDSPTIINRISPMIEHKQKNANEDYFQNIHKVLEWMEQTNKKKNQRKRVKTR